MLKASTRSVYTIAALIESDRLRQLVEKLAPSCVAEVDWKSDTDAVARSLETVLENSVDPEADKLTAALREIDRFGDELGRRAMWSVLAVDADLVEEFEAIEDPRAAAIWVFLEHPTHYERSLDALESDERLYKGSWGGFLLEKEFADLAIAEPDGEVRERLLKMLKTHLKEAGPRSRVVMRWFERRVPAPFADEPDVVIQVTFFIEHNATPRLEIDDAEQIQRRMTKDIASAIILLDRTSGEVDIVVRGGDAAQEDVLAAFLGASLGKEIEFERLERRPIDLSVFKADRPLALESGDLATGAWLREVKLVPSTEDGTRITLECMARRRLKDVYDVVDGHMTEQDYLKSRHYRIVRAVISFEFQPERPGKRRPRAIVKLTAPNKHNLHELPEAQKNEVVKLLTRWNVLNSVDEVIE